MIFGIYNVMKTELHYPSTTLPRWEGYMSISFRAE